MITEIEQIFQYRNTIIMISSISKVRYTEILYFFNFSKKYYLLFQDLHYCYCQRNGYRDICNNHKYFSGQHKNINIAHQDDHLDMIRIKIIFWVYVYIDLESFRTGGAVSKKDMFIVINIPLKVFLYTG